MVIALEVENVNVLIKFISLDLKRILVYIYVAGSPKCK